MSGTTRSRIRIEKQCHHCGIQFTVPNYRKDTALYCSRKCLGFGTRTTVTAKCEECNTEFTHISSRANRAKYCSRKCYHKAQSRKGTVEYVCQHCEKRFLDAPSHKRKYCSKACVNKANKATWRGTYSTVRKVMIARKMLTKCERCSYSEHPEILGVHHKDRNRHNNDLTNLEVLCPICHSLEHSKHISQIGVS